MLTLLGRLLIVTVIGVLLLLAVGMLGGVGSVELTVWLIAMAVAMVVVTVVTTRRAA